jgi:hypothetical protein
MDAITVLGELAGWCGRGLPCGMHWPVSLEILSDPPPIRYQVELMQIDTAASDNLQRNPKETS